LDFAHEGHFWTRARTPLLDSRTNATFGLAHERHFLLGIRARRRTSELRARRRTFLDLVREGHFRRLRARRRLFVAEGHFFRLRARRRLLTSRSKGTFFRLRARRRLFVAEGHFFRLRARRRLLTSRSKGTFLDFAREGDFSSRKGLRAKRGACTSRKTRRAAARRTRRACRRA
jgi:hypothetical protein